MRWIFSIVVIAACNSKPNLSVDAHVAGDGTVVDAPPLCRELRPETTAPMPDRFLIRDRRGPRDLFAVVPPTVPAGTCDVLAQTGCTTGQKCTWIEDAVTPQPLGHIGCVANGTVAIGGACTYGAPGATTGFDNCTQGAVCNGGLCKTICDLNGGAPACGSGFACSAYAGLFDTGGVNVAGACDAACNPLDDNDFLGSGSRPGSACAANKGCYGYPSTTTPTRFSCTGEVNKTLTHRTACNTANGCANSGGNPFLNGCAQGYLPLLVDSQGSTQIDCIAMCKPGNTYEGNSCTQFPAGQAPHRCNNTDARGTFNLVSSTNNGEQCMYSWLFELDNTTGALKRSPTSDTVGFCIDHSKYKYDSNGDGMVNGSDSAWPACTSLPLMGAGSNDPKAGDFGCVDSTTAGATAAAHAPSDLRLPYHSAAR